MITKRLLSLILILSMCKCMTAQVGFLSSNNKSTTERGSDTISLPSLTFTSDIKSYKKISDTFKIRLNYKNPALDLSNELRDTLQKEESIINNKSKIIQSTSADINNINNDIIILGNTNNNSNEIKELKAELKEKQSELARQHLELRLLSKDFISTRNKLGMLEFQLKSANTLNRNVLDELSTIKYRNFADKITGLKTNNEIKTSDLYKNQYTINSCWFLVDSTKENFNKSKFLDSLAQVHSQVRAQADINLDIKNYINDAQDRLEKTKTLIDTLSISSPDDYQLIEQQWLTLQKDTVRIVSKQNEVDSSTKKTIALFESVLKNNIKDKKPPTKELETKEFGAFPLLTSILGKREVIPQLQLYGSYNHSNFSKSFEANFGISFAPSNSPDTSNLYTIFIPTASKFLINSNFTWSFLPVGTKDDSLAKKIGLKLDVSFASKNLLYDTAKITKIISSSFLYAKAGIEIGIIPKRLSIYSNVNTATLMDKVDEFRSGTDINSKFFGYIDCGAKLYFDPTPTAKVGQGLFIYSNLNFIINSGDVKRITKTNDTVIPSIQVGIVKGLGRF